MEITREQAERLRKEVGRDFGLMDCAYALKRAGGDMEKAKKDLLDRPTSLATLVTRR